MGVGLTYDGVVDAEETRESGGGQVTFDTAVAPPLTHDIFAYHATLSP